MVFIEHMHALLIENPLLFQIFKKKYKQKSNLLKETLINMIPTVKNDG